MQKTNSHTFLNKKITNEDIYNEIQTLKDCIKGVHERQDKTNGKVKKSMWIASTALTITLILLGFLFQHMNK
jgi:hypothetical protein